MAAHKAATASTGAGSPLITAVFHGSHVLPPRIPSAPVQPSPRIAALLSKPSWSVKSLLPPPDAPVDSSLTQEKLHHLLRLSALPPPKSMAQEREMLKTLSTQIHFVKEIQKIDTTGVEPLRALRDETREGREEETVTLSDLQAVLDAEEKVGRNGRVKRKLGVKDEQSEEAMNWDAFSMSKCKQMGRYFYVRREMKKKPTHAN